MAAGVVTRRNVLRAVLVAYAAGHVVTAVLFLFWPAYFIRGSGAPPPWPLTLVHLGDWPPVHEGFMNVLAVYDLAVAGALLIAATDPDRHVGILVFAITLFALHGAVHAYHILWGSSPPAYWSTVAELWVGAALLVALFPRHALRRAAGVPPPPPRPAG